VVRRPQPTRVRWGSADGPAVRGAHRPVRHGRRHAWPREDSKEARGAAPGEGAPLSVVALGGMRARRRGVAARRRGAERGWDEFVLLSPCLSMNNSKILNGSAPNNE
jgi:hypothetical protein